MKIIGIVLLVSVISFVLLAKFYPPLNLSLFGGRIAISYDDIEFWVKRVPNRGYYKVYAKYLKSPDTVEEVKWLDFSHQVFYADDKYVLGSDNIFFNPQDNRIYGGGRNKDTEEWRWAFYCFGEGRIEGRLFKPLFPEGIKFTFRPSGYLDITSAPRDYIKIHFPGSLKKLEKEELGEGILAEIVKNEDPTRRRK